ncbi:hypothetical protein D3C80_1753070 [compost metagenome]
MQHIGLAGVIGTHPGAGLERGNRGDVEDLTAAKQGHAVTDGVTKPCQGEDVDFDQVLFGHPVLAQERPAGADACTIDQQVDLPFTFLQFQEKA